MKFLIINGPNINLLGLREPELYGERSYQALQKFIFDCCHREDIEPVLYQSNHEGDIVDRIQAAYGEVDGIVINPAAFTHTSITILDALKGVGIPAAEVHLTDINTRESFRRISYPGMACLRSFIGMGFEGYREAIVFLKEYLKSNKKETETG